MRKKLFFLFMLPFIFTSIAGCLPLIIGGAAGAFGAYAISKDTVQGDTDKSYDSLYRAALLVSKFRGTIKKEENQTGIIELEEDSSLVRIRIIRLTRSVNRLRVSSRKYHLPNRALAEEVFIKIMEQAE